MSILMDLKDKDQEDILHLDLPAAGAAAYARHQAGGQQGGAGGGRAPSVVSSSQSSNGPGGMMTAGRLVKEREAYGHHGPSSWQQQQQQQQQFGAFGPGPAAVGSMVGGGGPAQGQRRFSGSERDRSGSGSGGRYSGAGYGERSMVVHNPDLDEQGGQGGYAGGWSEEARRTYLAGWWAWSATSISAICDRNPGP
ncbi:hypothetical protein K435DRAFT_880653 [Dendrothele bispora CBS 962.96]|uniref:Uncharacterized protein n=1 Tax=Dendrothele bispora (strain CBS 962.96) TaxID=1314807 RepID=A0A4S8KJC4_DENBC|nr:hypothetical protein K435DRAFT_880653 [Dendrothele bispora CBS 962.96]